MAKTKSYPVSLEIEHPQRLDRLTSFFRLLWAIPILILLAILLGPGDSGSMHEAGREMGRNGGSIIVGLFAATALMILFRQRYPRWWFDFALELNRFSTRISAYILLLTDKYPSTIENQSVHLAIEYPDVKQDLNRWLPLVKWLLALPHYIVLMVLAVGVLAVTIIAWFAVLFTGKYPKGMFDFVVGYMRWNMRVYAYAFLLSTDTYPPFSFK